MEKNKKEKKDISNKKRKEAISRVKKDVSPKQRREIALAIRVWILKRSTVEKFSKESKFSTNTIDCWIGARRLPSLGNALKLEKLSNGELTKEFLCPQYFW